MGLLDSDGGLGHYGLVRMPDRSVIALHIAHRVRCLDWNALRIDLKELRIHLDDACNELLACVIGQDI